MSYSSSRNELYPAHHGDSQASNGFPTHESSGRIPIIIERRDSWGSENEAYEEQHLRM
jgi:hypothetical protein